MTDIHDITSIISPTIWPLLLCGSVILIIILILIVKIINRPKKIIPPGVSVVPEFPADYKKVTLSKLGTLQEKLNTQEGIVLVEITSEFHQILKWYLSAKSQYRLIPATMFELSSIVPDAYRNLLLFCYMTIYPWNKNNLEALINAVDTSIQLVTQDV